MASLTGTDTYLGQISTIHSALPNGTKVSGVIRTFEGTYTTTGASPEATGCTLPIVQLPVGAVLRTLNVTSEGVGGTSVVLDSVGDAGSATRYATADVALTAASASELAVTILPANWLTPFPIDTVANGTIIGTLAGTFPMTAAKKIVFRGTYSLP